MKLLAVVAIPFVLGLSGCGTEAKPEPPASVVKTEATAALKAVQKTVGEMMKSLSSLKDAAAAEQAKANLQKQLDTLKAELAQVDAGKLGAAWTAAKTGLGKLAGEQVAKYKNDPEMQKVVGPLLEQLKELLNAH